MTKRSTAADFINKANNIHHNKYDYTSIIYVNNAVKINILCRDHGPFLQTPRDHLSGYGCPSCGREAIRRSKQVYNTNSNVLLNEDDISYYLLGAYITDGNMEKNSYAFSITSKDLDWIENIKSILSPERPIYKKKLSEAFTLKISDKDSYQWFITNNCIPNKSVSVKFPSVPTKYLPDFIRGCIDGDGCLIFEHYSNKWNGYTHKSCHFYSASIDFIESYKQVLSDHDFSYSYRVQPPGKITFIDGRKVETKHSLYEVYMNGLTASKFINWIYYPLHKLSMDRKNNIAQQIVFNKEGKNNVLQYI